jgi:two-component system LytT family response regulator
MNKQITTLLVDDEPGSLATLEQLIQMYCPSLKVIGKAMNPIEAAAKIEELQPQLVFLDIEMPYGNAFDMLDKMNEISFEIIFVTAYNNYALKAFRYAAADYLLKPLNIDELVEAVSRVADRMDGQQVDGRIEALLENLSNKSDKFSKIILPVNDGFLVEDVDQIMYLNAEGSYTTIHLASNKKVMVSKLLKEFEDMLPEVDFCRIHHSTIININYVKKFYKGRGGEVEMANGEMMLISTRKKSDFLSRFKQ